MSGFLLRHLELILTALGLLVILGAARFIHPAGVSPWTVAAVTATLVGLLHGVLFWLVRQRQRATRRQALAEVQRMLRDVVNNQLAIIRLDLDLRSSPGVPPSALALTRAEEAITTISSTLANVSEESLARWHARYAPRPAGSRP